MNQFVKLIYFMRSKYQMDDMDVDKLIWEYGLERDLFDKQKQFYDNHFTIDQQTLMAEHARFKRMLTRLKGHHNIPMHIRRWIAYFTEPGWENEIKKWTSKEFEFKDAQEQLACMIAWKNGTMTPELREEIRKKQEARSEYSALMRGEGKPLKQPKETDGLPLFA